VNARDQLVHPIGFGAVIWAGIFEHTIIYLHLSRKHLTAVANPLDTIDVSRPEGIKLSRKLQKR